ncbi:hypothetical protein ILYODFUR_009990 [Ilyodon furcidens]|uniref:Uncharacterized protein n=1 Tax=Ilyodon furcidens TaxID=33524 RepID=A0ABV0UIZ5_9TELE
MRELCDEETLDSLESYVDECFDNIVMSKPQKSPPIATPTSKRTHSECFASTSTISPEKSYADVLVSIDKKLTSLDARLPLVKVLHREFQALRESLEFTQEQLALLTAENQTLRDSMKKYLLME